MASGCGVMKTTTRTETPYRVEIRGYRPYALTRRDAESLLGAPKLLQRLVYWTAHASPPAQPWLRYLRQGGRGCGTLILTASFESAMDRMGRGEMPPPMPSESKSPPGALAGELSANRNS